MKYLALLRGINVGGNNVVRMSDLRANFERLGLSQVSTYIQSGNVLFESRRQDSGRLSAMLEKSVMQEFGCGAPIVVIPAGQLDRVVSDAPKGFGGNPEAHRYDVLFVRPPLLAPALLSTIALNPGVDEAFERHGVVYFSRLIERQTESHLVRLVRIPAYKSLTVRNWRTTCELHRRMFAEA